MFEALDDEGFAFFVEALHPHAFPRGGVLYVQGAPGDALAVVLSGRFRVEVVRPGGKREDLGTIGPGDVIGEMTCVDPAPRSATVTALEAAEVLELDRMTLESLARRAPSIYSAVIGGIISRTNARLTDTNLRVESALLRLGVSPTIPQLASVPEMGDAIRSNVTSDEARALRRLAGLKGFTDAELATLVRVATPREYATGQVLLEEGTRGESCLIVTAGSVEVVKAIGRRERRLAVLPAGSLVGQIALVHDGIRQATVRALEHVLALELSRHNFERLLAAQAPLAIRFQEQVAAASIRQLRLANQRLASLLDRLDDLADEPVEELVEPAWAAPEPPRQSSIPTQVLELDGKDDATTTMAFIQAALSEWGMRMEDLDDMKTKVPEGQVSRQEALLRGRR